MNEGSRRVLGLCLTGPVEVRLDERVLTEAEIGGRRPRLLLAGLALHCGEALSRDECARMLWGDDLPPTWSPALRVAASRLRTALAVLFDGDASDVVVATQAGYVLRVPDDVDVHVDVVSARDGLDAAARSLQAGDPVGATELIRDVRPVLERRFLGDEGGWWAEQQRAMLRDDLIRALETLADARLALSDPVLAAAAAVDAVELSPYRESAYRRLIAAHRAAGNTAEALRTYERCRRRLADDLGALPSPETEALYRELLGEEPPVLDAVALPGRLRFVGRQRALGSLESALASATTGRGSIALVSGDAGIGKTRLTRELAEHARARGARVAWGACREPEWAPPFGAIADLLPALDGLVPEQLATRLAARLVDEGADEPPQERTRVREDLRRALLAAAQVAPLVVVVDDVQWADEATLAALRHLAPSVPDAAILVVLTARDVEPESPAGLALAALTRDPGVARLELAPLEERDVDELIRSLHPSGDGWATPVLAETGGNPFYVEALILHLLESGERPRPGVAPTAVRDVVGQRLRRLSPAAQALLVTASLVDTAFSLPAVAVAAGLEGDDAFDALDEAIASKLIQPADRRDTYAFCHAIARQSIAATLPFGRRVRLHRSIAEAIESTLEVNPSAEISGELAGQYHRSSSLPGRERGVEHALRAAERADATGGTDRAATFFGIALDLMLADDPRRPDVTARHGLALLAGAQHAEGASIIKEAADVLVAAGDVRGAASLLADSAWTAELAGFTDDAFALASIGVALVADGPEDDVWARLYVLDLRRREADDPRGLGIPIVTPQRRRAAELMHADPRHRDELAWAVWDHRDEILERGTDDVWALTMWAGRYGDALAMWQRRATAAEARGQLADAVSAWAGAASCAGALGRLADAANWTDRARELARRVELRGAFALHLVGARDVLVHARGSGFDDLMEWVAELTIYRTDRAQRWAEAIQYAAMARLLAIDTRYDDARTMIDGVVEVLPDAPTTVVSTNRMVGDVVAAAWLSGDTRHVGVLTESVRTGLLEPDFRCPMTEPRHAQGRVVGLTGDVEGARQWFDEARVVARADGLGPLIAIIDHDEALLLLRAGRAEDAAPLLDAARRRATRLGMIGWVRRTERLALGSGH